MVPIGYNTHATVLINFLTYCLLNPRLKTPDILFTSPVIIFSQDGNEMWCVVYHHNCFSTFDQFMIVIESSLFLCILHQKLNFVTMALTIKLKCLSRDIPHDWPFVMGIPRPPLDCPHKGYWSLAMIYRCCSPIKLLMLGLPNIQDVMVFMCRHLVDWE